MVCSSLIRSVIVQAGHIGVLAQGRRVNKTLSSVGFGFRISAAKMSVESSAGEKRVSMVDMPPHKVDDGGYIGGGWKKWVDLILFLLDSCLLWFWVMIMKFTEDTLITLKLNVVV